MKTSLNLSHLLSRRVFLGATTSCITAPALAHPQCALGPGPHKKGPLVFLDYDQVELDAAYDQEAYQLITDSTNARLSFLSSDVRFRLGFPERHSYGESEVEKLDIFRATTNPAPIFIFIHGGRWQALNTGNTAFAAEMCLDAGVHFVAPDFAKVTEVGGDLGILADQVRRAIAWVARNASQFGGDAERIYVAGHSSGGHLCAVALTTDWETNFDLPADVLKGGLCISGMYDMKPVRISSRRTYLAFTDAMEDAMSPIRHLDLIRAPITVAYGSLETPEFIRQGKAFAEALRAEGKQVVEIEAPSHHHQDMWESVGNPYGLCGRAALAMMKFATPSARAVACISPATSPG
ncbi:MAG: alpha/beta hydrolase [Limimaricola soesokkakensis]|uniref:alpha/beta hydrolase n=1 Tax=Limimaricola soesokkakensis TaxID=1343159 RepID=UPI00405A256E